MAREKLGHESQAEAELLAELLHSVQTFEAEIYYQRQEWDLLIRTVQVLSRLGFFSPHEFAEPVTGFRKGVRFYSVI